MKFWGVSQKKIGSSAHKFYGVLGSRGALQKCLNIFFGKMIGTASKKLK